MNYLGLDPEGTLQKMTSNVLKFHHVEGGSKAPPQTHAAIYTSPLFAFLFQFVFYLSRFHFECLRCYAVDFDDV